VTAYERQIVEALAATSVRGATRFAWKGRLNPRIDPPLEALMDVSAARRHLVVSLGDRLRRSWYCHGRAIPAQTAGSGVSVADQALVAALSAANSGRGTWQTGWTVERLEAGAAISSHGALRSRVPLADCRAVNGRLGPGAPIAVRLPKELPFYAPGFLHMVGDAELGHDDELVRVYWNVTAAGAAPLVRMLTSRLNATGLPFELKVATHPLELHRCDGAVLYLPADRFHDARPALAAISREADLRSRTPALTLELAPGVGLAEDLRSDVSFGTHRCALLAEAIVRAHEHAIARPAARVRVVADHFAQAGVAIDAPYRDPALAGRHVL
jgi:hypothetical protein